MKTLVIFDSNFGNTQKVADYIASLFGNSARSVNVNHLKEGDIDGTELLIVGSPINAWNPTKKIRAFLNSLTMSKMKDVRGAAFDTRLKSLLSGNAAKKIAKLLVHSGVTLVAEPIGFIVESNNGPLVSGELQKAEAWVQSIKTTLAKKSK